MAPFPWFPMLAISASLLSNAFSICSLFPYLGFMVQHMGVAETKDAVGFYTGFIFSASMLGRFLFAYYWGRFADQHGRLPVIYISLSAIAISSIGFGMSTNLLWAIGFRFLLGAMNAVDGATKTMISEVCGREHEISGMSFMTGTWSLGLVIGPGVGGALAEPARHFPDYFAETGIFGRYPYLLPNLVSAGVALLSMCMVYFFMEETYHPGHRQDRASSTSNTEESLCTKMTRPLRMLSEKRVRDVMIILSIYSVVQVGLPNVFPLWALSTVANGGLDWTSEQIGQVFSMMGVLMIVFQMCIYPSILKRLGMKITQRCLALTPIVLFPTIPMLSILRGNDGSLMVAATIMYFILNSCSAGTTINLSLVINHLLESGRRGEVNGLASMISALSKTLGPMFLSIIFAWSIHRDRPFPFGRHLAFVIMSVFVGIVAVYGWNIIRRDADEVKNDGGKALSGADTSEGGTERTKLVQVLPTYTTTVKSCTEQSKLVDSLSSSQD